MPDNKNNSASTDSHKANFNSIPVVNIVDHSLGGEILSWNTAWP